MIVATTPFLANVAPRLRNAVLVLFALFVAHDAVYVAQFGFGARYAQAMSEGGHDSYWAPVSLFIGFGAVLVFLATLGVLSRVWREAAATAQHEARGGPSYLIELATIWLRLLPIVGLLYGVQENLEYLATEGHFAGLGPLFGPGSAVVLPVLAATTFVLAVLGALVRWRIRAFQERIAAAGQRSFRRPVATRRPSEWTVIASAVAQRWMLTRRDAGRAPPLRLRHIAITTA